MEKLNIAEILKDCPSGMELDCVMYEDVYFDYVDVVNLIHCYIQNGTHKTSLIFNQYGKLNGSIKAKYVIFPKGKTTWEGFQRPFKDGDVVFYDDNIAIFKEWGDETLFRTYVKLYIHRTSIDKDFPLFGKGIRREARFATLEEKETLFKAIKDNGYRWNTETKTLEKLIVPKFKVGDRIMHRLTGDVYKISSVLSDGCGGGVYDVAITNEIGKSINIEEQDSYELVPVVPKFKIGDRIRHIKSFETFTVIHVIHIDNEFKAYEIQVEKGITRSLFARNQDDYELVPNKFDITTLKPFVSRVLIRDYNIHIWEPAFWGKLLDEKNPNLRYLTTNGCFKYCIPYENNQHLLGTTNDCDEYYKTWE